MLKPGRCLGFLLGATALAGPVAAVDGVREIHESCVAAGCFPGDTPGFPVQVATSGSYRLTSNLHVTSADTTAIDVTAAAATIDLNGFEISGVTVCDFAGGTCAPGGSGNGVSASGAGVADTVVRNGTVRGMGNIGVLVTGGGEVEHVQAIGNGSVGISVDPGAVRHCEVSLNGLYGISCGRCLASGNVVTLNLDVGMVAGSAGAHFTDNSVIQNRGFGISGFGLAPAYGNNVVQENRGNNSLPQVAPGVGIEIATNVCGTDTICP